MIPFGIVRKALRDMRGVAIGGAIAVFAIVLLHAAIYPSSGQTPSTVLEYPDALKGMFGEAGSINRPEGYTGSYMGNVTALLAVLAIIVGTGATAAEEGAGTLDLLLAQPIPRRRLLLAKATGLVAGLSLAALASIPGFLLGGVSTDQHMSAWRFVAAAFSLIPFLALFLALGLWAGASLATRAVAGTATAGVVVAAYFLNAIGGAIGFLETPRKLSPFYWIDPSHVLLHGFDWIRSSAMLAMTAVFLALAARSIQRREISVGARTAGWNPPWKRARTAAAPAGPIPASALGGAFASHWGIVIKTLRDVRGAALGAGSAALALVLIDVLLYPTFSDALKDYQYPDAIRGMLGEAGSIASPEGFMTAQFFSLVPLTLVTVAIITGTAAIAGEEGAGTLDLLSAAPIRRRRLLLGKSAGILVALLAATMAAIPGFLIAQPAAGMDLAAGRFIAALANVFFLEFFFLALAFSAGSVFPNRSSAVAATTAVMVAGYLVPTLAALSQFFETARVVSPFYWADASRALVHGFDPVRVAPLIAFGAFFLGFAAWSFERRDIGTGAREWRLPFRSLVTMGGRRPPAQLTEVRR